MKIPGMKQTKAQALVDKKPHTYAETLSFTIVGRSKDLHAKGKFWMEQMSKAMGREINGVTCIEIERSLPRPYNKNEFIDKIFGKKKE